MLNQRYNVGDAGGCRLSALQAERIASLMERIVEAVNEAEAGIKEVGDTVGEMEDLVVSLYGSLLHHMNTP